MLHLPTDVGTRRACALADICPNTWYYRSRARDASALRLRIREKAQERPGSGTRGSESCSAGKAGW